MSEPEYPPLKAMRYPDGPTYAWLLWGRRVGKPKGETFPLGCFAAREIALEAEKAAKEHQNAPLWDEFWITPWELHTEPRVNFRISITCQHPDCALYGAGGICGRHGIYDGVACPKCSVERN